MAGTSISLQHFHDVQEINVQAVFIVHIDALKFLIFFSFSLVTLSVGRPENVYYMGFFSLSLSWKIRICVLYLGFFSLSFSQLEDQKMVCYLFFSLSFSQLEDQNQKLNREVEDMQTRYSVTSLTSFLELFKYSIS